MSETIVFFGSGAVAATCLEKIAQDFDVEAVVTKPKPLHHKGVFPVIEVANKLKLKVVETKNKTELAAIFASTPFQSKLGLVIDYGIIISKSAIDYFPLGIVNSHFSLLPQWRGADPISFSLLSGQKETGVSLMLIDEKLDEGALLAQSPWQVDNRATARELTVQLIDLSHSLLVEILPEYVNGKIQPVNQAEATINDIKEPSYSRKLTKHDGILDFSKPAVQLEREIRAFVEWPRSRTSLGDVDIIITKAHVEEGQGTPGSMWRTPNNQLGIHTTDKILVIDSLIPSGKKQMTSKAFLAGYKLN